MIEAEGNVVVQGRKHESDAAPRTPDMNLRLELFVQDMDATIDFYSRVLGFTPVRREPDNYASLQCGQVLLGIGPVSKLPAEGGYFTREIVDLRRGLGVEIVLEVDDVGGWHDRVLASGYPIFEPLQQQPWGLTDFRIVDPDGYYLRLTSRAPRT
jgi:catechol 2,3-dioxygenase-like lactoylglutathione lyase family enzyme